MTYEKVTNEQLINLCAAFLARVKEAEKRHYFYNQQDWQELENATSELLKRAEIKGSKDLDACELSDFSRLIEKAASIIKTKYHQFVS